MRETRVVALSDLMANVLSFSSSGLSARTLFLSPRPELVWEVFLVLLLPTAARSKAPRTNSVQSSIRSPSSSE